MMDHGYGTYGIGFWRQEPGYKPYILQIQIFGGSSGRGPANIPYQGPAILKFMDPGNFTSGKCTISQVEADDFADDNRNYWDDKEFTIDKDGEIKVYGMVRGKMKLTCGKIVITIRTTGQSYLRVIELRSNGGGR